MKRSMRYELEWKLRSLGVSHRDPSWASDGGPDEFQQPIIRVSYRGGGKEAEARTKRSIEHERFRR